MRKFIAFLVAATAVIALVPAGASAKTGTLTGLYNQRYCEIFAVSQPNPPMFSVDIYNTVGLNDCPVDEWRAVDYAEVKSQTGSLVAVPNGPRRWLLDTIANGEAGDPLTLSGLDVRHVAVLEVPSLSPAPYTEMYIARTTTWVFNKGRKFHFLISPQGRRYALQAYTTNVDKTLRARNIGRIGSNPKMELPDGWTYKTVKLRKQLRLKSPGMTTILRDGLGGTYQRFTWPKYYTKKIKQHRRHPRP
ncbi:MAG: hypothetical protein J0H98_06315 [Solirubrobacterales bacterium]|nr:hypothetical protein [Solirubrobacterales bacterium]